MLILEQITEFRPKFNSLIASNQTIYTTWRLSFQLKVTGPIQPLYRSIISLSVRNSIADHNCNRIPAIFFHPDSFNLYIDFSDGGSFHVRNIQLNQFLNLTMVQLRDENDRFKIMLITNGTVIGRMFHSARNYYNVDMFSTTAHPVANIAIKDLSFETPY